MKIRHRIQTVPDGSPYSGATVSMRRVADSSTITTLGSDSDGWVEYQANGDPGPYYLYVTGIAGGDRFLDSRDVMTAGVLSLAELPVALRVLGDGVVRGYASALAVSVGADTITVASGAANVIGHPFVTYTATVFPYSRPVSGTRIDRIIIRLYPEGSGTTPGKADLVLLAGVVDAGVTALTQTTTVHEIGLAQITVPSAGAVTVTDERTWANESIQEGSVVRAATASTSNASGEALSGLSFILVLPKTATYDISAKVSARQDVGGWVLQGTFGSLGSGTSPNFNLPDQVAVDPSGNVYIADVGNNRVVKLNSSGVHQAVFAATNSCTGVAVDPSGNVYLVDIDAKLRKYTSAGVLSYTVTLSPATGGYTHIATDGTYLYITDSDGDRVLKRLAATGAAVATLGSPGTGDGQLNSPRGICTDGTHLWVSDRLNLRVQKLTVAGVYVAQWAVSANARGCALDDSGDVWVAEHSLDALKRYSHTGALQTSIAQSDPYGVAVASGDVVWAANTGSSNLAKWDELTGYGEIAIEINGDLSAYLGIGNRNGAMMNMHVGSATGPGSVVVRAFGKATSGTLSLKGVVLSATAKARR